MSHALLQQHADLMNQVSELEGKLHGFAETQLQLMREASVTAGFSHSMDSNYRYLQYTDWMEVGEGGSINCWERGHWGGQDEISGSFQLDPLVLDGQHDLFKQKQFDFFKRHLKTIEARKIQAAQKELEQTRAALLRQQAELNKKLAAMGGQS
jgi:hypothetical protein